MEGDNSRKRRSDDDMEDTRTKRSNQNESDNMSLKVLIPQRAAGAVMGKGGDVIGRMESDFGVKINMSKSQSFFPGTSERVCIIKGDVDGVWNTQNSMMAIIREKPDANPRPDMDGKVNYKRHKQLKFLVPNSTAGKVIGKSGKRVNEIVEHSGAMVNVASKMENNMPERIITVEGDEEQMGSAMKLILESIIQDPQSGMFTNVNYDMDMDTGRGGGYGGGPGYGMGGGFRDRGMELRNQMAEMMPSRMEMAMSHRPHSQRMGGDSMGMGGGGSASTPEAMRMLLRGSGYNELAVDEIVEAALIFAHYGLLDSQGSAMLEKLGDLAQGQSRYGPSGSGGMMGGAMGGMNPTSFSQDYDMNMETNGREVEKELEVGDHIIGAIYGKGGQGLHEVERMTGTKLDVSKKGIYAPGTKNRIVTISGPARSVQNAEFMLQQRIRQGEISRQRMARR